jgi:hypothetical protein
MTHTVIEASNYSRSIYLNIGPERDIVNITQSVYLYNTGDNMGDNAWKVYRTGYSYAFQGDKPVGRTNNKDLCNELYSELDEARAAYSVQCLKAFTACQAAKAEDLAKEIIYDEPKDK